MRLINGNATELLLCETGVGIVKQQASIYSILAVSVVLLTSCSEKTEFVSSQSQSNWNSADPSALAGAELEETPSIMPQTHYAAGRLFEKQGAAVRAAKQYKKALMRDPDHVPSLSRLGMIYAKQAHYPQAEQYLQKAVELWPNSPQARNNLGFCYVMQERWYDAEAEFRNTLKLDPSFVRARVNLAMALSKLNRFDESLGEFRLAVPEPEAYYNLGLLYRSAQRYEEAASAFATALKRKPDMTIAKQQLDRMKLQMVRTREYQLDSGSPQSTEFASSNQSQQQPVNNRTRTNQSFAMQPAEPQSFNAASSQPVASSQSNAQSKSNAQTASWSNPSTNTQSFDSTQDPGSQDSGLQYSNTQYSNEPVTNSAAIQPMEPVEGSPTQFETQHQDTPSVFVQDSASSSDEQAASGSSQTQQWSNNSTVETYETHPVVSTVDSTDDEEAESLESSNVEVASTETTESGETSEQDDSQADDSVEWDHSHFVRTQPTNTLQSDSSTEILPVAPVFVTAEQAESNQSQSEAPAQIKPIARPVRTQNVATTQPKTSNALVLEATPVEESYAPSGNTGRQYQRVETQQRSASSSTPVEPQNNASMTADLSEIESVEPVAPGTTTAPKKARTATHKSNSDDVEVKSMGKVGMAPAAPAPKPQTPKPQTQGMPKSAKTQKAAPAKAIEPAVLEMTLAEEASDNDADNSDSSKIEEDVEVVEMEAVED